MSKKEVETKMNQEQLEQELEYEFPYHYIPQFRENYIQVETWCWSKNYLSAIEFILKEIKEESKEIKVLFDVGCGDGRLTKELNFEFPDINIVGIDYSSKAIALAKAMNPDIEFYNMDIVSGDFKKKSDAITLIEVFEHIPIEICDDFVYALYQSLNDKGIIYLTVPHENVPVSYKHSQHFNINTLEKYFLKYFEVKEVQYIQKNSFFLKVLTKLFDNNLYVIKNNFLNNIYYDFYKKYHFNASENNCERMYLKLMKK